MKREQEDSGLTKVKRTRASRKVTVKKEVLDNVTGEISSKNVLVKVELHQVSKVKAEPSENSGLGDKLTDIEDLPNVFSFAKPTTTGPKNWTDMYNELVLLRARFIAPVDLMGCERIPEGITPQLLVKDPRTFRFQLLISLMLSSQTKDEVIDNVMRKLNINLKEKGFEKGVTLESIMTLSDQELDLLIGKVGFHNRKTVYIKKACLMLQDQYGSDIPQTIEEIVKLPGVGPKMGYLLLQRAWGLSTGIGVDVHLHRIAMMWGWARKSLNPEVTRKDLEEFLPVELWAEINPLLVGFGQVICTPQVKNCDICSFGSKGLCKSANRKLVKLEITEERAKKLRSGRGDVSDLLVSIESETKA